MRTTDQHCVDCDNKLTAEEITLLKEMASMSGEDLRREYAERRLAAEQVSAREIEPPDAVCARLLEEIDSAPACTVSTVDAVEFRRNAYGLNKGQMAKVLGLQQGHYSDFILGRRALPRNAIRRAAIIGVPMPSLLNLHAARGEEALPIKRGWETSAPASADALSLLTALRKGIPLQEPVYIGKALLAHREAHVVLNNGTGPLSAVHLVNIGLTGWTHTPDTAKAYTDGYNTALKQYRSALLGFADDMPAAGVEEAPGAKAAAR